VRALALIGLFVIACGASSRQTTIRDTFIATQAASVAFIAFDREHQQAIVSAATSKADGAAALEAYRAKSARVAEAFTAVWISIGAAATANDDPSFSGMLRAALSLSAELKTMGVIQ